MKINEAWKLWRSGGKTMLGESVTLWTLLVVIVSGIVEGTVHFFIIKLWEKIWGRKNKKD